MKKEKKNIISFLFFFGFTSLHILKLHSMNALSPRKRRGPVIQKFETEAHTRLFSPKSDSLSGDLFGFQDFSTIKSETILVLTTSSHQVYCVHLPL